MTTVIGRVQNKLGYERYHLVFSILIVRIFMLR